LLEGGKYQQFVISENALVWLSAAAVQQLPARPFELRALSLDFSCFWRRRYSTTCRSIIRHNRVPDIPLHRANRPWGVAINRAAMLRIKP
jgi:hypothetical protein